MKDNESDIFFLSSKYSDIAYFLLGNMDKIKSYQNP